MFLMHESLKWMKNPFVFQSVIRAPSLFSACFLTVIRDSNLMSDEGVQSDVGSLSDQFPHIVTVRLLDEVMETFTQQPVHPDRELNVWNPRESQARCNWEINKRRKHQEIIILLKYTKSLFFHDEETCHNLTWNKTQCIVYEEELTTCLSVSEVCGSSGQSEESHRRSRNGFKSSRSYSNSSALLLWCQRLVTSSIDRRTPLTDTCCSFLFHTFHNSIIKCDVWHNSEC